MTTPSTTKAIAKLLQAWQSPDIGEWQSPFIRTGVYGRPRNACSGHVYTSGNAVLLMLWTAQTGYRPVMLTFAQKNELSTRHKADLRIRRGEQGVPLIRPIEYIPSNYTETPDGYVTNDGIKMTADQARHVSMRVFTAFSVDQLNEPEIVMGDPRLIVAREPARAAAFIERLIKHGNIHVDTVEAKAHFSPAYDRVRLPDVRTTIGEQQWVATAFHELVHWTGHSTRLDRISSKAWADEPYAREELVAEIGAALLCSEFGIPHVSNAMAYIKTWASALSDQSAAFFSACADAQKAINLIHHIADETPKAIINSEAS